MVVIGGGLVEIWGENMGADVIKKTFVRRLKW